MTAPPRDPGLGQTRKDWRAQKYGGVAATCGQTVAISDEERFLQTAVICGLACGYVAGLVNFASYSPHDRALPEVWVKAKCLRS